MTTAQNEEPSYFGHRARLRERFLFDDGASMPDYEVLELLLMYAIPRRDVKPLAKKLIKEFGDLNGVLHASTQLLREKCQISDNIITLLRLVDVMILRSTSAAFADNHRHIFTAWVDFENYCRAQFGHKNVEEMWCFYFNSQREYLGEKHLSTGSVKSSSVPIPAMMKEAIDKKAQMLVLAHNHPSGICRPSPEDILITEKVMQAAEVMDLEVFDHIIVTTYDTFSFRANGYINNGKISYEECTSVNFTSKSAIKAK